MSDIKFGCTAFANHIIVNINATLTSEARLALANDFPEVCTYLMRGKHRTLTNIQAIIQPAKEHLLLLAIKRAILQSKITMMQQQHINIQMSLFEEHDRLVSNGKIDVLETLDQF